MAVAPIHFAAHTRDVETLRRLLAEGVSPDVAGGDYDRTPLLFLCVSPDAGGDLAACFKLLRDAGANLEAVNRNGFTPLLYAANVANTKIASLLLEAGANVNAANLRGWTALHFAAHKSADCVEVLLAAGASLNLRDFDGRTPFGLALAWGLPRSWPLFLRAGAEIPTNITHPYIARVRNAGGFKKYAQAHLVRVTKTVESVLGLPARPARLVADYWLHAGFY